MRVNMGCLDELVAEEGEWVISRRGQPIARILPMAAHRKFPGHAGLRLRVARLSIQRHQPSGASRSPTQTLSPTRQWPMPQLSQALKSLVLTGAEGQPQPSGDRVLHLSSGSRKPAALQQVYQAIYEVNEPLKLRLIWC